MPRRCGVSPLKASSDGPCWVVGRNRQPFSTVSPQLVGAGQGGSTGNLGKSVSMTLPSQAPGVSCSPFPLHALGRRVVPDTRRHRNQSRSKQQVLLSRSQPLASTAGFATLTVPCDPASAATRHLFQVTKPDNKKDKIKMEALGSLFSALLLPSLSGKESFPGRTYL